MEHNKDILLLELGETSWSDFCDRTEKWLDNVLLMQAAFRQLCADTKDKIEENHLKKYISDIEDRALAHEKQVDELYQMIGRNPSRIRSTLGSFLGKSQEAFANLVALGGGVKGPWQYLHQLYLSNHAAIGAFGVAEQLGLALGHPQLADLAFKIAGEKKTDELLLQEAVLEMCVPAVLYDASF